MKTNKKGFTLVELLAIIVVLAIIAVLAVPTILDTIKESKGEVNERSVENYIKAIETKIVREKSRGRETEDIYLINRDGNLCPKSKGTNCTYPLEIKGTGTKPSSGTIVLENGKVISSSNGKVIQTSQDRVTTYRTMLTINNTKVFYENEQATTDVLCYRDKEEEELAVSMSMKCNFGDGWKVFYILGFEDENITLMMNSNLGEVKSIKREDAESELRKLTKGWTKITEDQISLPDVYQLAKVSGLTDWKEGDLNKYLSGWPTYDLTCHSNKWNGYWTTNPSPETEWHPAFTYYIFCDGGKIAHANTYANNIGVRPVVTITKDKILY